MRDPSRGNAAAIIAGGGVIAIPTDTVYGLACDPTSAAAVDRIYAIKRRPAALELTLLAADIQALRELAAFTPQATRLAAAFWPGALSIILPVGALSIAIPRQGTTLSVRVPAHEDLRALLRATGPLASTSANRHGEPAATTAAGVRTALGADVDAVVDGGSGGGLASTIIDCSTHPPRLMREGPISFDELSPHLRGQ